MPTYVAGIEEWRADPKLAEDLSELLPDTTDDVPVR